MKAFPFPALAPKSAAFFSKPSSVIPVLTAASFRDTPLARGPLIQSPCDASHVLSVSWCSTMTLSMNQSEPPKKPPPDPSCQTRISAKSPKSSSTTRVNASTLLPSKSSGDWSISISPDLPLAPTS